MPEAEVRTLTEPRKTTRSYYDEDPDWRNAKVFSMWIYWYRWRNTFSRMDGDAVVAAPSLAR